MIDTKKAKNLALVEFSDWAKQNNNGTYFYSTAAQPEEFFRCALTLTFNKLLVDEFSRVVTFSDDLGNRMTLLGVDNATIEENGNCATMTIKCRKDPALGCKDRYIFKI